MYNRHADVWYYEYSDQKQKTTKKQQYKTRFEVAFSFFIWQMHFIYTNKHFGIGIIVA